jgi:hypothetical protein
MHSTWRANIAQLVLGDILTGHPLYPKIEALLITEGDFLITFHNPDGTEGNCGRTQDGKRHQDEYNVSDCA